MTGSHLRVTNWPECIPWTGPTRESAADCWGRFVSDRDIPGEYPSTHPAAASVGEPYLGDVCPECGVPLRWTEEVVLITGSRGIFADVDETADPTPGYHPECWEEYETESKQAQNHTLGEFVGGETA